MKNVVVTGANGFIGSWLVKELTKHNIQVFAVIRDQNVNIANIISCNGIKIIYSTLESLESIEKYINEPIDAFFHLAWGGSAGNSRSNDSLQIQNAQLCVKALDVAHRLKCKRFVVAGSIMEKEAISAIYKQDFIFNANYLYGLGKVLAHGLCKAYANLLGVDLIWGIITNAYGEGEISPRFINSTIREMLNNGKLKFTSGTQLYDFVHVEDVARALFLIGEYGKPNREYVIGSSEPRMLKDYIQEMYTILKPNTTLKFGEVPFSGIGLNLIDYSTEDIEKDTGFKASITFAEGIKRTSQWIKVNT
jgi:nucleoside-diphosphate-sugar epimerase